MGKYNEYTMFRKLKLEIYSNKYIVWNLIKHVNAAELSIVVILNWCYKHTMVKLLCTITH